MGGSKGRLLVYFMALVALTAWGTREYRERKRLEEVVRVQRAELQRNQLLQYPPQLR